MRSKLTKTIFIIVFVVFLGIIKAEGVSANYGYCYYKSGDNYALIKITDTLDSAKGTYYNSSDMSAYYGNTKNWEKLMLADNDYSAYIDFYNYGNNLPQCPQYLIYTYDEANTGFQWMTGNGRNNYFYMSDSTNLSYWENYVGSNINSDYVTMEAVAQSFPSSASTVYVEPKTCICESGDFSAKYDIGVNGDLTQPEVNGASKIKNWVNAQGYYSLDTAATTNGCVDMVYSGNNYYLVDSAHKDSLMSSLGNRYTYVACEVSGETPVSVIQTRPEYNPPTVNTGIVGTLAPNDDTRSCGNGYITHIPTSILRLVRVFYILIQIFVPIALVILGIVDLMKAITADKEDKIKEGQQIFVKRLIAAVVIFFVFIFVKLVISVFSNDDNEIISCMNCFLDGTDSCDR